GLECSMKARIMALAGVTTLSELKRRQPQVAVLLFSGTSGHDLDTLAREARVAGLLEADGYKHVLNSHVWQVMCNRNRPYSLRYGSETIGRKQAAAELEMARNLHSSLYQANR